MKPIFKNGCKSCVYLGTFNENDLYWCESYDGFIAQFAEYNEKSVKIKKLLDKPTCYYYLYIAYLIARDKGYV